MSYWTTDDHSPKDAEILEDAARKALAWTLEDAPEGHVPTVVAMTNDTSYQVSILVAPQWVEKWAPYRLGDEKFMLGLRDGRHVYIFGTDLQPPGMGKSAP